jgi:tetratricopeptide (TPR) repeat protein
VKRAPKAGRAARWGPAVKGRIVLVSLALFAFRGTAAAQRAPGGEGATVDAVARLDAELVDLAAEVQALVEAPIELEARRSPTFVEERITDAELHFRMHDYERAAILLTDLVDHGVGDEGDRARPDALFLLGEALFRAGDPHGARTRLRELLEHASEAGYRPYVERAVGRLIDVAIRTRSFDDVESYFELLRREPTLVAEASTTYFRGKYLYNRAIEPTIVLRTGRPDLPGVSSPEMLEQARTTFELVAEGTPYHPQALYFVGVIHALRREHVDSAQAFRAVLELDAATPEHRAVHDLARLSLARVLHEAQELRDALAAYQAIPETSRHYAAALFEGAWVHVRRNSVEEAERALAVMLAVEPDDARVPDAMLLRGHLLIEDERYDAADMLFGELRERFEPLRLELESVPTEHPDLRAHFRPIVREHLEDLGADHFLPDSVRSYLTLHGDFGRALIVLSDLAAARRNVAYIEDLIIRLRAVLEAPNPITVLRDLRAERERVEAFVNRLATMRSRVAAIEARGDRTSSGELANARARRRDLERALESLPTGPRDFETRDARVVFGFRSLVAQLPELHRALLALEARVHGAEHALRVANGGAVVRETPALVEMRAAVAEFRRMVRDVERGIEAGRLRVGAGDERSSEEADLRRRHAEAVSEERRLAGTLGRGPLEPSMARIAALEDVLAARSSRIDEAVVHRVGAMLRSVLEEAGNLEGYVQAVAELTDVAEEVVTEVVVHNYQLARQRLYDLVLRADLGHVEVGWARREAHRRELARLTRQRAREVDGVDRERRAILDLPLVPSDSDEESR